MMINPVILCISLFILHSCSIYQQTLDSCPSQGIACTAVSDLEQMIIETQKGPDIFLGINPIREEMISNRMWVSDHNKEGYFIYFEKSGSNPTFTVQQESKCCKH